MWRMAPIPDARLTCVSNFPFATYSGMLPGTLAGLYPRDRMQIDLVRLCAAAGARLIVGQVTGLDRKERRLLFADRAPLSFDALSVGVGSVPRGVPEGDSAGKVVPIKPMQTFLDRLTERIRQTGEAIGDRPLRVAVVGAGVAGIEITFCLPPRVEMILGSRPIEMSLIDPGERLSAGLDRRTLALVRREIDSRGVGLYFGQRVESVSEEGVRLEDGRTIESDLVLWATGAVAPPLLGVLGLPTDERGFLLTRDTLQTTGGDPVFAVGDTGTLEGKRAPKAGVFAVRQGPILWENLARVLDGRELKRYEPQTGFLKLMATGDRRAILSYKGLAFHARWCWRLKDRIDGGFMDKYQDYSPVEMDGVGVSGGSIASERDAESSGLGGAADGENGEAAGVRNRMRCAGCGGKIGGQVLQRVLERLEIQATEHVLVGLDAPDDAAVVVPPGGRPVTVTTDFFAAPLDDMFTVGRIAALNAASDAFAMGARVHSALAIATIPPGPGEKQESLLYELLAGAKRELDAMGATLVGGHTIEGPQTTIGFTILAESADPPRTKGLLRPGDRLVLTKPLGTGVLLAAQMQARCRAEWMGPLLDCMLQSNQPAATVMDELELRGMTDVTGFGLAGHLLEMLHAADLAATITLDGAPLLPGVAELLAEGLESTLAPANRDAEAEIAADASAMGRPEYAALFDPQTSGGLLLAASEEKLDLLLRRLGQLSNIPAAVVGRVERRDDAGRRIRVV